VKKKKKRFDSTDHSTNVNVNPNAGSRENQNSHGSEMSLQTWQKAENHYTPVPGPNSNSREDPNQAIYSELGPGGRVGPKPTPASSNYAEVKVDEYGYPITGETTEPAETTLYDQVKRDSADFDDGVIV